MRQLDDLQRANLAEIESLNQRGGRTLSIVDLIADGTLTVEMGGYLLAKMADGASVLTVAGPGGTGKSTLLANLLGFLPPGERITSTASPEVISCGLRQTSPACYLAHEIGSGHWYGYIWGRQVAEFFSLAERGHRLAAAIHADTLDELTRSLYDPPLNVSEQALRAIELICFMVMHKGTGGVKRRVSEVHALAGDEYCLAYSWNATSDRFTEADLDAALFAGGRQLLPAAVEFVQQLVTDNVCDFAACRRAVLDWYTTHH